ncbi:DEAD/DEAH family ATP-dependent RNA helicase [Morganella psychrotolerans]|uniref:ATP-dependent RNA helicase DeaD n=1 Tax=Morganella psychrotolerans TaxID=368603 RepID=A0A5M9R4N2_9GAMM|nr:DEAD/DEAH family ATP-dependent RNA helicase [Morganella psychrotolerans]KAA8715298.1 DEAD/DEAH family ATP-dependent RNA helicase [Morganella psychrotolerans]OBU05355.1 DEAD/DEAH family ATP-dependent RNA helicase [Morganella psychrotolerans]
MTTETELSFAEIGLSADLLTALDDLGYEKPSPIQQECIPHLLAGRDVLGMAQTGSGKTAAFGLPLLHNIDASLKAPQILVLAPTRELAVQVAEAFTDFSKHMRNVNVVALYGGQRYDVQLRALRQGPQIVVGTPGRLLDHLKRGTLDLSKLKGLVLDEADEMLRMGFIEDVETIMSQIPANHQTALFSATMPEAIRRITRRFMKDPQEVRIQSSVTTRPDISQSYWTAFGARKSEALVRFLEAEDFDAAIIFVRTKNATLEVAESLERSGYNSAALNGDMNQSLREQTLERLKDGRLDILIATDVAARGLDVERISLVVNYDIPMDAESYVHRIGRTGRAGRAGRALLFVENRERRLLRNIERTMKLTIPEVELPNADLIGQRRQAKFAETIRRQLESSDLDQYRGLLKKLVSSEGDETEVDIDMETLAAALLKMAEGERKLILPADAPRRPRREFNDRNDRNDRGDDRRRGDRNDRGGDRNDRGSDRFSDRAAADRGASAPRRERRDVGDMELYRIEVGRTDGVEVRHIVGAIANEGDINSRYIGNIKLFDTHSTIELPKGMPTDMLQHFIRTRVMNKPMNMTLVGDAKPFTRERRPGGSTGGNGGNAGNGGRSFGGGNRREGGSDRPAADRGNGERRSVRRDEGGSAAPRRRSSSSSNGSNNA